MKILTNIQSFFWPTKENHYLPHSLSTIALCAYIFLFFIFKVIFGWEIISVQKLPFFADISSQALANLTNETRQDYGLAILNTNPKLEAAAQQKAQDMINKGYFAHFSPSGTSPWYWMTQSGYQYKYAGENLAINFIDSQEALNAWMDSTGHRENILNPNYKEIGIAVVTGKFDASGQDKTVVVQLFGSPSITATKKETKPATKTTPTKTETAQKPSVAAETTTALTQNKEVENLSTTPTTTESKIPLNVAIATNKKLVHTVDRSFSYGISFLGIIGVTGVSIFSMKPTTRKRRYLVNTVIMILIMVGALIMKPDLITGALAIF